MTIRESIEILNNMKFHFSRRQREALGIAILSLGYRIKKKPVPDERHGFATCPTCGVPLDADSLNNFCGNCGQALNISEVEG